MFPIDRFFVFLKIYLWETCYGVRLYNIPERYSEIASDYSKRSDS